MSTTTTPPAERQALHYGRLKNLTARRPRGWVKIAVPFDSPINSAAHTEFVTDRGLRLPALRAFNVGTHSWIWAVRAPFSEGQTIEGHFMAPLTDTISGVYQPHPWVSDNLNALIPACSIRLKQPDGSTDDHLTEIVSGPTLVSSSEAHQRWHTVSKAAGFVLNTWTTFWSYSPVADFSAALVWSDPTNPEPGIRVEGIALEVGEYPVLDHARRHGIEWQPVRKGDVKDGKWVLVLSGPRSFSDGSGLPLTGRLLCLPQDLTAPMPPDLQQDLEEIFAGLEGPLVGAMAGYEWDGHWLAHGNVARLHTLFNEQQMVARVDGWLHELPAGGDWYDRRSLGCSRVPAQTGGQEDFGSTKGTPAFFDPAWLHQAQESVHADLLRAFCYHEASGQPMDPADHPEWRSWAFRTHWRGSGDYLGKRALLWGEGGDTGWTGYDDEHRSQNNLAAHYALTGDPLDLYLIERSSAHDIASAAHYGYVDSARAFGRRALTYANVMLLSDPGSELYNRQKELLAAELDLILANWTPAKYAHGIDVLGVSTDARSGITYDGQPIPYWSPWVNAILCVGAYAAWKVTRDTRWLDIVRRVSRTVTRYAYFLNPEDSLWWSCDAVAWGTPQLGVEEGAPLPAAAYAMGSTLIFPARGGVAEWQLMAPLIFIETHEASDPDMPRALDIVRDFTQNHEATSQDQAEWMACVDVVPPQPIK